MTEKQPGVDPRILAAWRQWLSALATDAEATIAAAHVYLELDAEIRDAWLDALVEDAPKLGVPLVAVYAPLLAVETDPARFSRIQAAMGGDIGPITPRRTYALRGVGPDRSRIVVLIAPLYLSYVQVLTCRFSSERGFTWVQHDPICLAPDAPKDGVLVDGVHLEPAPLQLVAEELAHAVLAQRRSGRELPQSLRNFSHLFDANVEG